MIFHFREKPSNTPGMMQCCSGWNGAHVSRVTLRTKLATMADFRAPLRTSESPFPCSTPGNLQIKYLQGILWNTKYLHNFTQDSGEEDWAPLLQKVSSKKLEEAEQRERELSETLTGSLERQRSMMTTMASRTIVLGSSLDCGGYWLSWGQLPRHPTCTFVLMSTSHSKVRMMTSQDLLGGFCKSQEGFWNNLQTRENSSYPHCPLPRAMQCLSNILCFLSLPLLPFKNYISDLYSFVFFLFDPKFAIMEPGWGKKNCILMLEGWR